jgi:3',5'-cyclic AMP phosphodiesterase CpdA
VARFTIAQLTDTHLGATWSNDPAAALRRAVAAVHTVLGGDPAAVVVSGDIANTGADGEYAQAREILDGFGAPVLVIPGNHDERDGLRRHFDVPDTAGDTLTYSVDLGPVRLVALDTKRSDSDAGRLGADQLGWLDGVLGEAPDVPTLIAMHHPPLLCGMPAMDAIGIPAPERAALDELLSRHRQVHVVACGHVHRAIVGRLGAAAVIALPSTDMQLRLDLESDDITLAAESPCVGLHLLVDGRIVSHVAPVSD